MYSVFLVDDEPIILDGIRKKIDWDSSGFTFAGEATDGEIALSMLQEIKPDILITDIKMPFMDGLQLSAAIKKYQPWIKIIILSGHDEFEYAKKAISIGIEEYMLKPFTAEDILATLNKVASTIDKERKQLSDISKMKEELKSNEKILQKEFLLDLVHGSVEQESIHQKCQELNIDLMSRYYKVIMSHIESNSNNTENLEETLSLLNSYSASWEQTFSFFHKKDNLVCISKSFNQQELEDNVYRIAETISHIGSQNSQCNVVTAIGKTVEHLSSISESYEDAKRIISSNQINHENRIISSDDLQAGDTNFMDLKENNPLVIRLKYAGKNDVQEIIQESIALINDNPSQFTVFASYILVDLIFAVSKLVENLGGNIKTIKPEYVHRKFIDSAVQDKEKFIKTLEELLYFSIEFRDSKITGRYGDVILKAKKFIEENYADQNTTLTSVAQEVCLSPNHFSTIFSQECKTTFIEYLTNVRIENAKRLIRETDMKGYDIAYECGFSDPHYFSYIFKKNTGMSPREYKLQK